MKIKSIVTAVVAAGAFGASIAAISATGANESWSAQVQPVTKVKKLLNLNPNANLTAAKKAAQLEYFKQNVHEGSKRYIVRLQDKAVASYHGGLIGLEATNKNALKGASANKFDPKSKASKDYAAFLDKQQDNFLARASSKMGFQIPEIKRFKYAINGFVTQLTYSEALELSKMSGVEFVEQERMLQMDTDTGPLLIGAGEVWDGTATGSALQGEGIIIGVLDSGVNTDHPSFAATGDDGYTVVNPLGDDVYLGDCVADPSLCNSKLIGLYSYAEITDVYNDPIFPATRPANGEDYDGHGSHTASTAGGNVLIDVPYTVPDFLGGDVGDGLQLPYTFSRMSGVAPHANIIGYQVCLPGNTGDTYSGCPFTPIISGIDQAIQDGVDVINYSIGGSTPFSPWTSSIEIGFLNAQAAGIFVATSAGNSGPNPSTTTKVAPWYTSVAASNHGNDGITGDISIGSFTGGDTTPPADISGGGANGDFTGDMVYAGDFANPNDPGNDPAQCLQPFPAGTFTATQIVVCDRGAIARVQKAANAAAGGAGGFVLANLQGGATTIANDFYAVPGIHIDADSGDALKAWIASGTGHMGTISPASLSRATNTADQVAGFSSRGPNEFGEIITPQVAAPGVAVYAANADENPFKDVTGPAPSDYAFLQGTSMASPHVAGSAALVMQAQPTWGPDEVRSALMMTAQTSMLKEDGATAADPWDIGAGRVQVDAAVNAGLVLSETQANYLAADPAQGGDPKTLNVPSMANFACGLQCSWTRTFTAVTDGVYDITTSDAALTASPTSIDATAGQSYSVTFTMDVSTSATGEESFAQVDITSASSPDLHLPVYVKVNNGSVPDSVAIIAGRNDGSVGLPDLQSIPTDNLTFIVNGLFDANATGLTDTVMFDIATDPTNDDPFDDLSQVFTYDFDVGSGIASINVNISETTATDLDLFVLRDTVGDGSYATVVAAAQTAAALEVLSVSQPIEGAYRVVVQNWEGSAAASDTGTLNVEVVPQTDPLAGLSVSAPMSTDGISPLNARLHWDLELAPGDSYFADITVMADDILIGNFPVTLDRTQDDANGSSVQAMDIVARGDSIDYTLHIQPSVYPADVGYEVSVDMPTNVSLVPGSVSATEGDVVIKDPDVSGLDITSAFDIAEDPTNGDPVDDLSQVHVIEFEVVSGTLQLVANIAETTSPDIDLFVYRDSAENGTFASLVGQSATAATLETVVVDAPAPGMYRVVVQNWAASGPSDTGTLRVTSDVAVGEGFLWNVVAQGVSATYSVVDMTDPVCSAAGLGGWAGTPGYVPLSAFGIGTSGAAGDEVLFSSFGTSTFTFFGQDYSGLLFSDNGFINFDGNIGNVAWNNVSIPNASVPNNIIAALWQDQVIVDDGDRGIRLANLGPVAIVDFDRLESFGIDTDRFTYQVQVMSDGVSDDHAGFGPYEVIVSWATDQTGSIAGATAGVENANGTVGVDASTSIAAGGQICFDQVDLVPTYEVSFSISANSEFVGPAGYPVVTIESDMAGTSPLNVEMPRVELVNLPPVANAGPDANYNRRDQPFDQISLEGGATTDQDLDVLQYNWTQTSGEDVNLSGSDTGSKAWFRPSNVENGTYTFVLSVSDGEFTSTDEVTITLEGSDDDGVGSFGWILLLLFPFAFIRRRLK